MQRKPKAGPSSSLLKCADSVDSENDSNSDDYGNDNDDFSLSNDQMRSGSGGEGPHNTLIVKAKNREHAKNTRLRKKNFIETLKDEISVLSSSRDMRERERKVALTKLADQVWKSFAKIPLSFLGWLHQLLFFFFSPCDLRLRSARRPYPHSFISAHRWKRTQASGQRFWKRTSCVWCQLRRTAPSRPSRYVSSVLDAQSTFRQTNNGQSWVFDFKWCSIYIYIICFFSPFRFWTAGGIWLE